MIINPVAGSAADLPTLVGALAALPGVRVLVTTCGEDAEAIAREAVGHGFRRIVAGGGDGTINGVLNGIAPVLPEAEFGILPLGTGNDLAASLGVRVPPLEAVRILERWDVRPLDIIRVRCEGADRLILNGSAGGFVQNVGAATDQGAKRGILGSLSYMLTAVMSVTELAPYRLKVRTDRSEQEVEAIATIVSNGRTLGGGVPVNPDGLMDDGLLEMIVIPEMPLADLALLGVTIVNGRHRESDVLVQLRGSWVELTSTPPLPVNADGEAIGFSPVRYEVLPKALRVVVGQEPAIRGR